jgi:paraquat-inducible protein B
MRSETNKTLIGGFIIGAGVLVMVGLLIFGSGSLFKDREQSVLYFDGSIKGLGLGSGVQFKGVPIGKVTKINLIYAPDKQEFYTRVVMESTGEVVKMVDSENPGVLSTKKVTMHNIDFMIANGLRAKLQLDSFVTGKLLVALDFYPGTPLDLKGYDQELKELPTLLSDFETLTKAFDNLKIKELVQTTKKAIDGIEALVNSPDLQAVPRALNDTLKSYRRLADNLDGQVATLAVGLKGTLADTRGLVQKLDRQVDPVAGGITGTTDELRAVLQKIDRQAEPLLTDLRETATAANSALKRAEAMLTNMADLSDENSSLVYQAQKTLDDLSAAARAMSVLATYLGKHPEALLQGKEAPAAREETK